MFNYTKRVLGNIISVVKKVQYLLVYITPPPKKNVKEILFRNNQNTPKIIDCTFIIVEFFFFTCKIYSNTRKIFLLRQII